MKTGKTLVVFAALIASLITLSACQSAWQCNKPAPVVEAPIPAPAPEPAPMPEPPAPAPLCEAAPVQVYFETNKFALTTDSHEEMTKLAHCLAENPSQRVTIEGHADKRGSAKHNLTLSQKRADYVGNFLKENGAPEATIQEVKGLGATEAFGKGRSKEALAKNRTTTVTVTR